VSQIYNEYVELSTISNVTKCQFQHDIIFFYVELSMSRIQTKIGVPEFRSHFYRVLFAIALSSKFTKKALTSLIMKLDLIITMVTQSRNGTSMLKLNSGLHC